MGAEFVVRPDNYIDRRMWVEGGYEKAQLTWFLEQARQSGFDTFIDIGANFGLYSCIFGVADSALTIHSFECDPRNLYHFYGHLRMNGLTDRVTVHPFALGDDVSDIIFQLAPDDSTGRSHVGKNGEGGRSIIVQQKPLDQVLSLKDKKLLIKIDVEGYEEAVLKGMRSTLENNICLVQVEILGNGSALPGMFSSIGYENTHHIGNDWYFSNLSYA